MRKEELRFGCLRNRRIADIFSFNGISGVRCDMIIAVYATTEEVPRMILCIASAPCKV